MTLLEFLKIYAFPNMDCATIKAMIASAQEAEKERKDRYKHIQPSKKGKK